MTDPALPTELDAIRAAFPALQWESVTRTEEGWDHVVVICHGCSGDDALGHSDLVFRFPTDEQAEAQLPTEIAVLEHLAPQVESALPRYTHVPVDAGPGVGSRAEYGTIPFAGYPMVRGDRLTPELLRSLPFTEQTIIATQLGSLLSALHIQDVSAPPMDRVPASYQPENLDFVRGIVENNMSDVLAPDEMRTAREICDEVAALQSTLLPRVFLHYDIYSRHLYWESGTTYSPGRLGLIDFTDMCIGDPAIDFAELYEYGPRFVEDVLARYVGRVDAGFLDRAWTYQRLASLYVLAGHLYYGEETWEYARSAFDRCRSPHRPRA
ncbi:aminoglycoside phosphotransferase [Dietzia sp. NCCP-2495]|uniref:aminoglycoside phosphotransferase family protein n=1 Tax=Dietzia sp. NCCP-2495 TaxID=2934675 RepID=UPI0022318279|nr:aminoglycoside phosphotransferase family protein [Dietzia sp. NCCP-2495]GLB63695.1 aminoglycoside phosphotransferase [Dietzia sp. NCCP-2495]